MNNDWTNPTICEDCVHMNTLGTNTPRFYRCMASPNRLAKADAFIVRKPSIIEESHYEHCITQNQGNCVNFKKRRGLFSRLFEKKTPANMLVRPVYPPGKETSSE